MKRFLALALIVFAVTAAPADNATAGQAEEALINRLSDEAVGILGDRSLTPDQRMIQVQPLFHEYLDLPFIGRFVLGRHWRPLPDSTKDRYTSVFGDYVSAVYARRLEGYSGEKIMVTGSRAINERDVMVSTTLNRPDQPPVSIGWRVRTTTGKIIDVVVEGVSMVISQREEFDSYLQQNSVDDLISRMKSQI